MSDILVGLPVNVRKACAPVFALIPPDAAMSSLVPRAGRIEAHRSVTEAAEKLTASPDLVAALWLYADELHVAHEIVQNLPTSEGAFWHGILHRREGDFSNAKYWFRSAGTLPSRLALDPIALTDEVARHHRDNPTHLIDAQRREWEILFTHCAKQAA